MYPCTRTGPHRRRILKKRIVKIITAHFHYSYNLNTRALLQRRSLDMNPTSDVFSFFRPILKIGGDEFVVIIFGSWNFVIIYVPVNERMRFSVCRKRYDDYGAVNDPS